MSMVRGISSKSTAPPLNFEDILDQLGGFGKFQFITLVLLLVLEIPAAFVSFLSVFVGTHSSGTWYCGIDRKTEYSSTEICSCNSTISATSTSNGQESIVAEWELVCETAWVSDFITSLQMLAMLCGCLTFCLLSDWFGRRYTFLGVCIVMGVGHGLSAVAFDPYSYAATRFISGFGLAGYLSLVYPYAMEFQPTRFRQLCSSVGPWGEGIMIMALIAYYIRPWRILTAVTTAPFLLIGVIFPVVPESPRWLLRNQRLAEAHNVLGYMAKINGKPNITMETLVEVARRESPPEDKCTVKRFGYLDFFRDENLRYATICQIVVMLCGATIYYGMNFNAKNMHGSVYLITMLLGLSEATGIPSALLICNRFGRRISVAMFMTLAAIVVGILAVLEVSVGLESIPKWAILLCLLGKYGSTGGRSCARTLIGELYPTAVRGMGSGLGGAGASFGAIIAPQLAYLGSLYASVPYFAFGIFGIMAAFFSFLLPETTGKPLMTQVTELSDEGGRPTAKKKSIDSTLSTNEISLVSNQI